MNKPYKPLLFHFLCMIILISCNEEEAPERTPEDEQREINEILQEYIGKGLNIDTTENGAYYFLHKEGTGPYPKAGDKVFLEYRQFIDGKLFDATSNYHNGGIWEFIYLYQDLPIGLNDGIALMNEGTEMDLIVPSNLAYGKTGTVHIRPYTTLVYKAKMHKVEPKNQVH